jgi:hypothetical protein
LKKCISREEKMSLYGSINPLNAELNPIRHLLALVGAHHFVHLSRIRVNPLNAELNPIRHLLALAGAYHFVDVSRIRVNELWLTTSLGLKAMKNRSYILSMNLLKYS